MKTKDMTSSSSLILLSAQLRLLLEEKSVVSSLYLTLLDLVTTLLVFRQANK